MKKITVTICLFLSFLAVVNAQETTGIDYLKKMQNFYKANPEFSVNVLYKLYTTHTGATLLQQNKGFYHRKDSLYVTNYQGAEIFAGNDYTITVVDQDKAMYVKTGYTEPVMAFLPSQLDSMEKYLQAIYVKDIGDSLVSVQLIFPDAFYLEFIKTDIVLRKSDYSVQKVVLYYRYTLNVYAADQEETAPRLEIEYSGFDATPGFATDYFSANRYIVKNGDTYTGKGKYTSYSVIKSY